MTTRSVLRIVGPSSLILGLWLALFWYPTSSARADAENQLSLAEAERSELIVTLSDVRQLPDMAAELDVMGVILDGAIPVTSEIGPFVEGVNQVATASEVSIDHLAPTQLDDNQSASVNMRMPDGVSSITFGIAATCRYEACLRFLRRLEESTRLTLIDSVEMFSGTEELSELSMNVEFRIFTRGSITSFGAIDQGPTGSLALTADGKSDLPLDLSEEELAELLEGGELE